MDEMVLKTQEWLNATYGSKTGFNKLDLGVNSSIRGKTGWTTIYALIRALQIELGIPKPADNFGDGTKSAFRAKYPNGIKPAGSDATDNVYGIIQGALWCKGYSTGHYPGAFGSLDCHFDSLVEAAVQEMKTDAGLSSPNGIVTLNVMNALLSMDSFVIGSGTDGEEAMRAIQQELNRNYEPYFGLMPCDGVYGRNTNKALIYALQAEEGLAVGTANGNFGPSTQSKCPTLPDTAGLLNNAKKTAFTRILQHSLYCNYFMVTPATGVYDSATEQAVRNFQAHYALDVTGVCTLRTWMSLLSSSGDTTRPAKACDCATILTASKAQTLKDNGYEVVGRYLSGTVVGGASKALTRGEINLIFNAGLRFFPIYQDGGTSLTNFTPERGASDAFKAYLAASELGVPKNTIIYFAVDFDALDYEITSNIIPYFAAIYNTMKRWNTYKIGIYGARNICTRVCDMGYAESSFVSDMSTGFSGNLGFRIPANWAFDQFKTVTVGSGAGQIEIDKDGYSGLDVGVSRIDEKKEIDIAKLKQLDEANLSGTHYYANHYNSLHTGLADAQIPSEINDYNILACLQTMYAYYCDQRDYEKTDDLFREMLTLRKLHPSYRSIYSEFLTVNGDFDLGYHYYAPSRKTSKVLFKQAKYFSKDVIRQMHQSDDWAIFMASLIPGIGQYLSALMSAMSYCEQNQAVGISEKIIAMIGQIALPGAIDRSIEKLLKLMNAPSYVTCAINVFSNFAYTSYNTNQENRETYVKDGVTLQNGDSYLSVALNYDMGAEEHWFQFYFRNDLPYVTDLEQYTSRTDNSSLTLSAMRESIKAFTAEGYEPSENHALRGQFWPL